MSAVLRSMYGGNILPLLSRSGAHLAVRFTNCLRCGLRRTAPAQATRHPTGVGAWWLPISIASCAASHSKTLCFRADSWISIEDGCEGPCRAAAWKLGAENSAWVLG